MTWCKMNKCYSSAAFDFLKTQSLSPRMRFAHGLSKVNFSTTRSTHTVIENAHWWIWKVRANDRATRKKESKMAKESSSSLVAMAATTKTPKLKRKIFRNNSHIRCSASLWAQMVTPLLSGRAQKRVAWNKKHNTCVCVLCAVSASVWVYACYNSQTKFKSRIFLFIPLLLLLLAYFFSLRFSFSDVPFLVCLRISFSTVAAHQHTFTRSGYWHKSA